jgi:hypothetical protein
MIAGASLLKGVEYDGLRICTLDAMPALLWHFVPNTISGAVAAAVVLR